MVDQNCAYCMEGELVAKFGIKICELETSKVYLFKEQSHPGRCIVAHKKHVGDMNEPIHLHDSRAERGTETLAKAFGNGRSR